MFVAWEILFNFGLSSESLRSPGVASAALWRMLLFVPEYVALWRYGHRSSDLWNG